MWSVQGPCPCVRMVTYMRLLKKVMPSPQIKVNARALSVSLCTCCIGTYILSQGYFFSELAIKFNDRFWVDQWKIIVYDTPFEKPRNKNKNKIPQTPTNKNNFHQIYNIKTEQEDEKVEEKKHPEKLNLKSEHLEFRVPLDVVIVDCYKVPFCNYIDEWIY